MAVVELYEGFVAFPSLAGCSKKAENKKDGEKDEDSLTEGFHGLSPF